MEGLTRESRHRTVAVLSAFLKICLAATLAAGVAVHPAWIIVGAVVCGVIAYDQKGLIEDNSTAWNTVAFMVGTAGLVMIFQR